MIRFLIVGSGSKGNATFVYDETTLFQIDMGLSFSRIKEGLDEIQHTKEDIKAILITHEHTDHVGGLPVEHDVPNYASEGTVFNPSKVISPQKAFPLGDFVI